MRDNGKVPFQFVDRPTTVVTGRNVEKHYPLDAIMATAETGGAVRMTVEQLTAHLKAENRDRRGATHCLSHIKGAMRKRGFALEYSYTSTRDAVDLWCVPIGAGQ